LDLNDIILPRIGYLVYLITHIYLGHHLMMIVRRYVATFYPRCILFCDAIDEKVKVTKYIQRVGYQHVLLSNNMQYQQDSRFSVI